MANTLVLLILSFFLSMLPFTESGLAIPFTISLGLQPWMAFISGTLGNIVIIPFIFLFLDFVHSYFMKFRFYRNNFNFVLVKIRKKEKEMKGQIEKYGYFGLALFIAIPFPLTGAYTASLLAWTLNLKRGKSMIFIALGVEIAALLITLFYLGLAKFIGFF